MMRHRQSRVVKAAVMVAAICIANSLAYAAIKTYSRTFYANELVVYRYGGTIDGYIADATQAVFQLPASAGAGDEVHINLFMAPGSALKFLPLADIYYYFEAYLWNDGGGVNPVGTSELAFSGASNINNLAGTLDYETSITPSWRASRFATRAEFLTNPNQPGLFTDLHVTFTIPAGYPTSNFAEVYMNIGCLRALPLGGIPPAQSMLSVVPEPTWLGLMILPGIVAATRRRAHPN